MGELQHAIAAAHQHQTAQGQGRRGVIPAPVGGWNTQDPEASYGPVSFGTQMENYFPERGRVISRRGSKQFADTTDTGAVETLFNWVSGAANKLFAITGTKLYDVTDPASVTEGTGVTITEGRWRTATMNGQGILVNGTDEPLRIDSTGAWVSHGFTATGLLPANLTQVAVFKNRLFFLEKDAANLWYGDLNAITGPLHKINLGLVNESGGNCLALGSLTLDTGVGVDDLLAICMSRGDVLIYAGTDPSTANAWQISGQYKLGPVIGDRPLVKLGGDLIAITSDGYIPLLQFIGAGREQRQLAISDKIAPTVTQAVATFGDVAGWQAILFSEANWLLFNVPEDDGGSRFGQHVQNVQTGAWCSFRGMNARCWETFKGKLYFGTGAGQVMQADTGGADGDTSIRGIVRSAYNYLQSPYDKQFRLLRAHIESGAAGSQVQIGASVDFDRNLPVLVPGTITTAGTPWDTAPWDTFKWGSGLGRFRHWRGVNVKGAAISVHISSFTRVDQISWFSSDVVYDQVTGAISNTG